MTKLPSSRAIATYVSDIRWNDVPPAVAVAVHRGIADTLSVAVAGTATDAFRIVDDYVAASSSGRVGRVLGSGTRTTPADAALANGVACHALDFDDDDPTLSVGHPSGPIVAALAALIHSRPFDGRRLAEAYLAGIEVTMRLGAIMNPPHFDQGWHATATLGALGATAAVAKVLDLTPLQIDTAFGIAASSASGIRANFGTMTKPLHVGMAARSGLVAAELAAQGFTSSADWFTHESGYVRTFTGRIERTTWELARLGREWAILDPGLSVKPYPSCSNTHTAIDALLSIRAEMGFDPEDVARIVCEASPGTEAIVIYPRPRTGLEGKFSMEHCLAVAAIRGAVVVEDFTDEAVAEASPFARRVELKLDPTIERSAYGVSTATRVTVELRDGRTRSSFVHAPRGSRSNPMTHDELRSKFVQCVQRLLGEGDAGQLFLSLNNLAATSSAADALEPLFPRHPS